ncbi:S8 family serine peptidase [Streptomyces heliomycini]|uniref:S8 family serine peptidase n=2 Tax=Streptomyces TaxID=1883 RepID=A0ABV5L8N8_9ACTN
MRASRRGMACLAMAGLVLSLGQPSWAGPRTASAASDGADGGAQSSARHVTFTLLTGDRVTVASSGAGSASIQPARGRENIRFLTLRSDGDLYVIPQDAEPLIRTGRLDRRLFNIGALTRNGYSDQVSSHLPVMVGYRSAGTRKAADSVLDEAGATMGRKLPAIDGAAASVSKRRAGDVWKAVTAGASPARTKDGAAARLVPASGIERIWLDGKRQPALDRSVPQIGAPTAWKAGLTGKGVTVAVLDGGVDTRHPDLAHNVAESRNFTTTTDEDTVGHGTHVASTIAGSGAASGGKHKGVAPDATLISGKVCESVGCSESAMLAGMEWAAAQKQARIVSISIGGGDAPDVDPLEEAVDTLTERTGSLFVIAAGNSGPGRGSIGSPGSADAALTVGAVDKSDRLADFSSRGPRVGDDGIKPDITAPGVDIVAARATGTSMGTPVDQHYTSANGTSMATPHVSGAAALLAQKHPGWKAGELKAALMASATPNPGLTVFEQGAGRADVARALSQTVTVDPASLSFGKALWPHHDDKPVTKTVTYRNTGDTDVTFDLTVRAGGPDGAAAPAGMFRTGTDEVTVPAGGQAQVTLTADTSVETADGMWSGRLVAAAGQAELVTTFSVHKEVESYSLTLDFLDRTGNPAEGYFTRLINLASGAERWPADTDGTLTVRLPKGRYGLMSMTRQFRTDDEDLAMLARPELVLDRDTSLTVDPRRAKPIAMTAALPETTAALAQANVGFNFRTGSGRFTTAGVMSRSFNGLTIGQIGPPATAGAFTTMVTAQWAEPSPDGLFSSSPYLYAAGEEVKGRVPDGFAKHYTKRSFTAVRHDFQGTSGQPYGWRNLDPGYGYDSAYMLRMPLPSRRTEYYTPGIQWGSALWVGPERVIEAAPRPYKAGRRYTEQWNKGPFVPGLADTRTFDGVIREGDTLIANPALFSDAAGHVGSPAYADRARTALYRDGQLVGETEYLGFGMFNVPAARATYRLEASAEQQVFGLGSRVDAAWTFPSQNTGGTAVLPLLTVGFSPRLDGDDAAPSGHPFTIPVTVKRQPGAPGTGRIRTPGVEVSYDDGKTWRTAEVNRRGKQWAAVVQHPSGSGHVSLRATASDTAGSAVTQSVIRAYRLK